MVISLVCTRLCKSNYLAVKEFGGHAALCPPYNYIGKTAVTIIKNVGWAKRSVPTKLFTLNFHRQNNQLFPL